MNGKLKQNKETRKNKTIEKVKKLANQSNSSLLLCDYEARDIIDQLDELEELQFILKMQNEREYHSKFLKDFQKENGDNVYPDHDEIYKRYDKYKDKVERAYNCIADFLCTEEYIAVDDKAIANNYGELMKILGDEKSE